MAESRTIGITGGIGSGKSFVSAMLREGFGIPVYDCDAEAKRLTASDAEIRQKLISLVGQEVFCGQQLNKRLLADYLFSSPEKASSINAIIHPAVLRDFMEWRTENSASPIVGLESAILYESGFDAKADVILFVDAPIDLRLRRAMLRDAASAEQVKARMQMQQPELHRAQADFIIDNSTDNPAKLQEQLATVVGHIAKQTSPLPRTKGGGKINSE